MLRSVKYGLYAAVLAGMVGGTVAWQSVDKTVHLTVDGGSQSIHTTASRVSDVLSRAGYDIGAHDIVAPDPGAAVHDGSRVVLARGRLLHLDVNGVRRDIWTTAPTVAAAMDQLGFSTANFTSVSRSRRLPLTPTSLTVRTPQVVTVAHDGVVQYVTTTDETVGQVLADLGVTVAPTDRVTPATTSDLHDGLTVRVGRVIHKNLTAATALAFKTSKVSSSTLGAGQTQVLNPGKAGIAEVTYDVVFVDGKEVGRTPLKTVVVRVPQPQVVEVGTKAANAPSAAAPTAVVTPGSAQELARTLMAKLHPEWDASQFNCLVQMWSHESGWRVNAANPSGAYGIPQALPGSKMGPGWQTDAAVQITWGLGYIASRYSTPCGAWSLWQSQGWY